MTQEQIDAETARAVERAAQAQAVVTPEFKTIFGVIVDAQPDALPAGD